MVQDWRPSPEAPSGHTAPPAAAATGREGRRAGSVRPLPERTAVKDALERRPPRSASLLRPQRQTGRKVLGGLALVLGGVAGGVAGGFVLSMMLRPGALEQRSLQPWTQAPAAAAAPSPAPLPSSAALAFNQGGLPKSPLFAEGPDARPAAAVTDAEALRKSLAAEQARLEALARARAVAEAQLAQLQEQVAQREQATQREILARREAALASLPSVTAPRPAPSPRPQQRAEPASGAGSGAQPAGAGGHQRVVLHHRAGSYAAAETAGAMAAQVRDAGFDLTDTRAVTATPSQRVERNFHAEDAPAPA
ncbi:MAG: hypothetical protein ICV73_11445, partial [Acetobacteraceae bacterium]|nr:hypothetical protein [Acetobacteraceae bacterium]